MVPDECTYVMIGQSSMPSHLILSLDLRLLNDQLHNDKRTKVLEKGKSR